MFFILPKKLLFFSRYSNFCTSFFCSFLPYLLLLNLWENVIEDKFESLWYHDMAKPEFEKYLV